MIALLFGLFISTSAHAAKDSVAVFLRPEKVVILVHDKHADRLAGLIDSLELTLGSPWITEEEDFKISCGMDQFKVGCTLSLFPSERIQIGERTVELTLPLNVDGTYETQFESSMKDKALFKIENGVLRISAEKREGYTPPKKK